MNELLYGLRQASRTLRARPASALVGVVTLALGIGGTTAFFGVLDAAYLRPLPLPHADRLVRLLDAVPSANGGSYLANLESRQVEFLIERSRALDAITAQRAETLVLLGAGEPLSLDGASPLCPAAIPRGASSACSPRSRIPRGARAARSSRTRWPSISAPMAGTQRQRTATTYRFPGPKA